MGINAKTGDDGSASINLTSLALILSFIRGLSLPLFWLLSSFAITCSPFILLSFYNIYNIMLMPFFKYLLVFHAGSISRIKR